MKSIAVIHRFANIYGGGEKLTVTAVEHFTHRGFEVHLFTMRKISEQFLREKYPDKNIDFSKVYFHSSLIFFDSFSLYQKLLVQLLPSFKKFNYVFNASGTWLPCPGLKYDKYVLIIYVPYWDMEEVDVKYRTSKIWKMYYLPYRKIARWSFKKLVEYIDKGLIEVYTDARWMKELIEKRYNIKLSGYIYPPVNFSEFSKVAENTSRENIVVSLGRYSPDKKQDIQILIAKKYVEEYGKDCKFVIIGGLSKAQEPYFNYCKRLVKEYNLEDVVLLKPNLPFHQVLEYLSKARVFLHSMGYGEPELAQEPLSIACLEGIASGCLPLLYAGGGAFEIVNYKKEYLYTNIEEAAHKIAKLLSMDIDEHVRRSRELRSYIHANFSEETFKKNLDKLLPP